MTIETKSAFARRIDRVPSYITELIRHGRLVLTADGKKIEVEASLALLEKTASGLNPAVAARHAQVRQQKNKPAALQALAPDTPKPIKTRKPKTTAHVDDDTSRAHYERVSQHFKNSKKALEFDLYMGRRFGLVAARREAMSLGNTLRATLERLIDQTAPRLAVMGHTQDRLHLLQTEIKLLTSIIKAEYPRALRRLKKGQKPDA